MKRYTTLLLLAFSCCSTLSLFAQNQKPDPQAMMQAMTAYMTPSEMHKEMAKYDGTYNATVSLWMDPNQPPTTSTDTCTYKMVMGGRYQEGTFSSTIMGQPMEGKSIMAYNNAKKVFENTWIDNMGTGILLLTGNWNDATNSIELTGTQYDPMSGKDVKVRQTMHVEDDKHLTMTMYMSPDSTHEVKSMEVKFVRKS